MGKLKWLRPFCLAAVFARRAESVRPSDHSQPADAVPGGLAESSRRADKDPGITLDDSSDPYHLVQGVTPTGRWLSLHNHMRQGFAPASSNAESAAVQTGSTEFGFEEKVNFTSGDGPEKLDMLKGSDGEAPLRSGHTLIASMLSERELEERQRLLKEIPRLLKEQVALEKRLHEDELELTQLNGSSSPASHANGSDSKADKEKDPQAPFTIVDDEQDRIYDNVKAASLRLESRIAEMNKVKLKIASQLAMDKIRLEMLEKRLQKSKADEAGTKASITKLQDATDSAQSSIADTMVKSLEAGKAAASAPAN